ncbi:MAG: hypothetical protein QF662_06175 [Phycisphaerae bacterium]|jgi:hypothetical protein|nr:hypothetical protein [Phycisphaerae bacterium]
MSRYSGDQQNMQMMDHEEDKFEVNRGGGDPSEKKKIIMLVALMVMASVVVGWRFLKGKGTQTADATPMVSQADRDVEQLLGNLKNHSRGVSQIGDLTAESVGEVVQRLYRYSEKHQVPLNKLQTDPFKAVFHEPSALADENVETEEKIFEQEPEQIVLGGILVDETSRLAVLDGQICREGDVIKGHTVTKILTERVELTYGGQAIMLSITESIAENRMESP